jgi:phage regulator Rha-like protein
MSKQMQKYGVQDIVNRIFSVRDKQVMLDAHLAEMYDVETRILNQAVKRNLDRFPDTFRFQLTTDEFENLGSQIATSNSDESLRSQFVTLEKGRGKHRKYLPYVFTEQGVAMLSAVLRSDTAVKVSIQIMSAFVEMRKIIGSYSGLLQRMDRFELKQTEHDQNFEKIFKALEGGQIELKQGVFFDGQTFDAYTFTSKLIKSAKKSIQLIDNYVDESVLMLLTKRGKGISTTIYTKQISKVLEQDLKKHKSQYDPVEIKIFDKAHDRFLIIDHTWVYHIGASLKDLGKKWFAFSLIDKDAVAIIDKIKNL